MRIHTLNEDEQTALENLTFQCLEVAVKVLDKEGVAMSDRALVMDGGTKVAITQLASVMLEWALRRNA